MLGARRTEPLSGHPMPPARGKPAGPRQLPRHRMRPPHVLGPFREMRGQTRPRDVSSARAPLTPLSLESRLPRGLRPRSPDPETVPAADRGTRGASSSLPGWSPRPVPASGRAADSRRLPGPLTCGGLALKGPPLRGQRGAGAPELRGAAPGEGDAASTLGFHPCSAAPRLFTHSLSFQPRPQGALAPPQLKGR